MTAEAFGDRYIARIERSYAAVAHELPAGWTLSLRCIAVGSEPGPHSDRWVAVAEGPDAPQIEGHGPDPERALAALHEELNR